MPGRTQDCFYRTAAGAEIDLILEMPAGRLWPVGIKRGGAIGLAALAARLAAA